MRQEALILQQRGPYRFDRTVQFWEWIKCTTIMTSAQLYEDIRKSGALPQHIFKSLEDRGRLHGSPQNPQDSALEFSPRNERKDLFCGESHPGLLSIKNFDL